MIHSLSGGVLAENETFLFAKVEMFGAPCWYLAPFRVEAGDRVLAPYGREGTLAEGVVLKTELCTPQTAPCSMKRVRSIEKRAENG